MGCDGGTIPKRKEIVKNKSKHEQRDKNADLSAKWQFCALSGLPLKRPVVACQLGKLYNKDAIIEHLLELRQTSSSSAATASTSSSSSPVEHIKSLRDVKELKLVDLPEYDQTHQASSGNEHFKPQFMCPLSGLAMNGKYKFYYVLSCGCVLSERALKQVGDDKGQANCDTDKSSNNKKNCIVCATTYQSAVDLIVLNGDEQETEELQGLLSTRRRLKQRDDKKQKPSTSRGIKKQNNKS